MLRQGLLGVTRLQNPQSGGVRKPTKRVNPRDGAAAAAMREKAMIMKQFKSDQKEKVDERDARGGITQSSVANKAIKFGGNLKTYKDVGVDLNKKGG